MCGERETTGSLLLADLIFLLISSESTRSPEATIAAEMFGNKWKSSIASRVECAVRTLNLSVSSTSLRTETASAGSGSTTSSVGRGTVTPPIIKINGEPVFVFNLRHHRREEQPFPCVRRLSLVPLRSSKRVQQSQE